MSGTPTPRHGQDWTRDELILALDLYHRAGVRKDKNDPSVRALASLLGRTPNSVALKLANFESVDSSVTKKAMDHTGPMDRPVFEAYTGRTDRLRDEADRIRARMSEVSSTTDTETEEQVRRIRSGSYRVEDDEAVTKIRHGQSAFAKIVKANYGSTCAVCGVDFPALLIASHIKPWSDDLDHRLDPANGLCLCALHDRLFDQGFISISPQLRVLVSSDLRGTASPLIQSIVAAIDGVQLRAPTHDSPDTRMLDYHRQAIFRGS